MRVDNSNIKSDDGRGGRMSIEVSKEEAENFASFAADGGDIWGDQERVDDKLTPW